MPFLDGKPVIITKRNVDDKGNPISIKRIEKKQVMDIHNSIPVDYSVDRNYPVYITDMYQIYNKDEITENTFWVDYDQGILYFHPTKVGKSLTITYMGTGYILVSSTRIYRYNNINGINTNESIEASIEKLENLMNVVIQGGGGLDAITAEVIASRTDKYGDTFVSLGERLNNIDTQFDNLTMIVKYKRTETMRIVGNTVAVGINEYNPKKDILNIYLSGSRIIEGIDYTLDKSTRVITKTTGNWNVGDQLYFEVYQRMIDRNMLPDTPITSMNSQNVTVAPSILGQNNVQDALVQIELAIKNLPNKNEFVAKTGDTMTGNLTMRGGSFVGNLTGNASTATTLQTAKTINGTSFNGSQNIDTIRWGASRSITIGNSRKSVNGSADVSWSLDDIGVASKSHTQATSSINKLTGYDKNASTGGALSATDTLNVALSKLEKGIDAAIAAAGTGGGVIPGTYLPISGGTLTGDLTIKNAGANSSKLNIYKVSGGKNIRTTLDISTEDAATLSTTNDANGSMLSSYSFGKDALKYIPQAHGIKPDLGTTTNRFKTLYVDDINTTNTVNGRTINASTSIISPTISATTSITSPSINATNSVTSPSINATTSVTTKTVNATTSVTTPVVNAATSVTTQLMSSTQVLINGHRINSSDTEFSFVDKSGSTFHPVTCRWVNIGDYSGVTKRLVIASGSVPFTPNVGDVWIQI